MTDPSPTPAEPAPDEGPGIDFDALPPVPEGTSYRAEWWIATSHLRSKKSEAFVSLVTVLSILGVVAGVAVLNWVISVMSGFEIDLRDKILGTNAHIVVLDHTGSIDDADVLVPKVEAIEGIEAVAPFVYSEMMIRSAWSNAGIVYKGVDPFRTGDVTSVRDDLEKGPHGDLTTEAEKREVFESLAAPIPPRPGSPEDERPLPGILLGRELQLQLAAFPGDTVQVVNPIGKGAGPLGMPIPQVRSYRVAGIYYSGMYEYDTKWAYVSNDEASDFLGMKGAVTGLEIKVSDIEAVDEIWAEILNVAPYPHYTRHWMNLNQKLFEALALEKWVMGLILSMIVVVAALLIVTTLIMLVITKGREIAILKAMGASKGAILRVFVIEGTLIGLVGTVLGTILGLVGCWALKEYGYPLETDVYYLSELPVVVDPGNVALIAVSALVLCFLATLYPAWKAASVDPVEGLRYE